MQIVVFILLIQYTVSDWHHHVKSIVLTTNNYLNYLGQDKHVIVDFFTPWCMGCQKMGQAWNNLYEYYHEQNHRQDIIIAKVNCDDSPHLCEFYAIEKYPSIFHFNPNDKKRQEKFSLGFEDRTTEKFIQWIESICIQLNIQSEKQQDNNENKNNKQFEENEKQHEHEHNQEQDESNQSENGEEEEDEDCTTYYEITVNESESQQYDNQQWVVDILQEEEDDILQLLPDEIEIEFDNAQLINQYRSQIERNQNFLQQIINSKIHLLKVAEQQKVSIAEIKQNQNQQKHKINNFNVMNAAIATVIGALISIILMNLKK